MQHLPVKIIAAEWALQLTDWSLAEKHFYLHTYTRLTALFFQKNLGKLALER